MRDEIDDYAEASTTPTADWLSAVADDTYATQTSTQMLSGPLAGRLLDMLAWISGARRVLEIGTYTGYSALTMAATLPEGGTVTTLELDPERAAFARSHMDASPFGDRVEILVGSALESLDRVEGPFDLVFIDADKTGYPAYFERVLPLLSERGVIVLDNMLRGGDVLDPEDRDPGTSTIRDLNLALAADPRVAAVLLPVRDGMTLVRRAS